MSRSLALTIPALPEFGDHRIRGKAVVPAAFLLDTVVRAASEPGLGEQPLLRKGPWEGPLEPPRGSSVGPSPPELTRVLTLSQAVFPRFLLVDEIDRCTFALLVTSAGAQAHHLALRSTIALPGGAQRTREHVALSLGESASVPCADPPGQPAGELSVPAARLYDELIPFGPRYRNLHDPLRLSHAGAEGVVSSPDPPFDHPSLAGCPYLFDSAMHLACLWGQRYAAAVLYPTGFVSRTIVAPVARGERLCRVVPRPRGQPVERRGQLEFDVWLLDDQRRPCDVTLGLAMVPIVGGPPPPAWIVHPAPACPP